MLHQDLLSTLCHARDRQRETPEPPLSVREIAAETGMSLFHFIRLYKAVFGETPNQCQIRARLEKARRLLITSDCPVTDVCLQVGYSSLGTFSDLFLRKTGMTPSAYRERFRHLSGSSGEIPHQLIPDCFSLMYK